MMDVSALRKALFFTLLVGGLVCMSAPWATVGAEENITEAGLGAIIRRVAQQNMPAVVNIMVTKRQGAAHLRSPFDSDPFFPDFFNGPRIPQDLKWEWMGMGTGMIMDRHGYILTSSHLAEGATEIEVLLDDDRRYPAILVGTDPKTDLAVILISTDEPLPHVTFGDSDRVEVGDWVVAIGCPRSLARTVSQGIISANHRRGVTNPNGYQDFLQTDGAINPGNIGGPLLNLQGEVIGVNAAIVSQSADFKGIGFAVPSKMAIYVAQQLIGHINKRPFSIQDRLGVDIRPLTSREVERYGLDSKRGLVITAVAPDSPLVECGFEVNDMVLEINGWSIKNLEDFAALINALRPQQRIILLGLDHRSGRRGYVQLVVP